jgi:antitoxin HicB
MKETKKNKTLEDYLNTTYPFVVYPAEEGGYVAEIEELPGCMTQAETLEELSERIENARRAWIQLAYENGMEIPLPRLEQDYSGRFIVRLPKYLHRQLAEEAALEGASLNQFVVTLLSSAASRHELITAGPIGLVTLETGFQCTGLPTIFTSRPWDVEVTEEFPPHQITIKRMQDLPEESVAV